MEMTKLLCFMVGICLLIPSTAFLDDDGSRKVERVLLISIDGFHQQDLARFVSANPSSTLAFLSHQGLTYTNASTSKPSDSFPGMLALATGGTPRSTGVYYDNSYDRRLAPPVGTAFSGVSGNCTPNVFPGTEVLYDETIDKDLTRLDAGGGIDPNALPRDPAHGCAPVFPHQFLRVNTIFEVIKSNGLGRTAWSDKHPAYEILNGPSGAGVDDLFTPEINNSSQDITGSIAATEAYDDIKVQAILNEIDGKNSAGTMGAAVPVIFGMNFQAVSVGQKLPVGGYLDGAGTPTTNLEGALAHTDASLGKMVAELQKKGLFDTTLIIITAKHGQSPIDRSRLRTLAPSNSGPLGPITTRPSSILAVDAAQVTEDDIALVWLKNSATTAADVALLEANRSAAAIQTILAGDAIEDMFGNPATDTRVPDIAVQPNPGVIYTGSTGKIAEHGGFAPDDTHVGLLVSMPGLHARRIDSNVETRQVAPTILKALGLDPHLLKSVQSEHTQVLPGLQLGEGDD
jgi:hypothetical protein